MSSRDIAIHLPSEAPPFFGLTIEPGEIGFSAHTQIVVRLAVEKEASWERLNFGAEIFDRGYRMDCYTIHMLKVIRVRLLYLRD